MLIKQPPFPHNKIFIFRITKASYYRNVSYSSLGENVLKIGYNLPLGILADYKRRVRKVSLEGNIIFDKVLVLANPVNNCFKHKQCYFVQKMCSLSHSFYLTISSCFVFRTTGPGSPMPCCEREYPTAAAVSLVSLLPRLNTTSPLDVQGRCLPNAFPRVLVEALLTCVVKTL